MAPRCARTEIGDQTATRAQTAHTEWWGRGRKTIKVTARRWCATNSETRTSHPWTGHMDFAVGRPALGPLPPEGHRCGGTPLGFLNSAHMVKWLGCALCEFNRTVYQKSKTNLRFGTPTQRSIVVNLCFFLYFHYWGGVFFGQSVLWKCQHGRSFDWNNA